MSEYIKREDVISDLRDLWDYKTVDGIRSSEVLKQVQEDVKSIPPADVVEVVRCKKCKYRIDGNCYVSNFIAGLPCMIRYVGEDDYCSYGKPKEQESE